MQGARLASPEIQGSLFGTYSYHLAGAVNGFTSLQAEHVGSFPNGFPNSPGTQTISPEYGHTDTYTDFNAQTGFMAGKTTTTFYVENLGNSRAVVYIHPESFVDSRYGILRPRTLGVRVGYQF